MNDILNSPRFSTPAFEILKGAPAIGWDFDQTLYLGENDLLMHAFIRATPEKKHYIVTFRSHGLEKQIWNLLIQSYDEPLTPNMFTGVFNVPDSIFAVHHDIQNARILNPGIPRSVHEDRYQHWKAQMCRRHGMTVLVDDMTDDVGPGCALHRIVHIHPADL
jgi:hypothetical protein